MAFQVEDITSEWLTGINLKDRQERNGGYRHERILNYLEEEGYDSVFAWQDLEDAEQGQTDLNDKSQLKGGEFKAIRTAALMALSAAQHGPAVDAPPVLGDSLARNHAIDYEDEQKLAMLSRAPVSEDPPVSVVPLLHPNNTRFNSRTGKLTMIPGVERTHLVLNEEALNFIARIRQKVGVVAICGKARTGKSLIAGELVAPGGRPCPFDLGHMQSACTYGIWMGLRAVRHPDERMRDTVLLVLDVEGTDFHEADPRNDYQLMVVTLLISSLLIYNVQKTFGRSALDEIEFLTELTSKIACRHGARDAESDAQTHVLSRFFPVFFWLLRDSHLDFRVDGATTLKEYFINSVLRPHDYGYSVAATRRNLVKRAFQDFFPAFEAAELPPPASNPRYFQYLGTQPLQLINRDFAEKVEAVVENILMKTPRKMMITSVDDLATPCDGPLLVEWIKMCVEQVNIGVPNIETIGSSVFRNQVDNAFNQSCDTYRAMLTAELDELRERPGMPLQTSKILAVHRGVVAFILGQDGVGHELVSARDGELGEYQKERLQEFYIVIGHDDLGEEPELVRERGRGGRRLPHAAGRRGRANNRQREEMIVTHMPKGDGLLQEKLRENEDFCRDFCEQYLDDHYAPIRALVRNPGDAKMENVLARFNKLQQQYGQLEIRGESMHERVWKNFERTQWKSDQAYFRQYEDYNAKLLREEVHRQEMQAKINQEADRLEELERQQEQREELWRQHLQRAEAEAQAKQAALEEELEKINNKMEVAQQTHEEELARRAEEHAQKLVAQQEKIREEQEAREEQYQKLREAFQEEQENVQKTLREELAELKKAVEANKQKEIQVVGHHVHGCHGHGHGHGHGHCGCYHGPNYHAFRYSTYSISYSLSMSSKYSGPQNTYAALVDPSTTATGAGTTSSSNQYIQANFGSNVYIRLVLVGAANGMSGGWGASYLNGCQFQYYSGGWHTLFTVSGLAESEIREYYVNVSTTNVRLFRSSGYVATCVFKFCH